MNGGKYELVHIYRVHAANPAGHMSVMEPAYSFVDRERQLRYY